MEPMLVPGQCLVQTVLSVPNTKELVLAPSLFILAPGLFLG